MQTKKIGARYGAHRFANLAPNVTRAISVDQLLSMLDGVRVSGGDNWSACCPAHDDKNPSLSITDKGDKILLKCWAGCTFEEICASLGIKPQQLFADCGTAQAGPLPPSRSILEAVAGEALILYFWAHDRLERKPPKDDDSERVKAAFSRLTMARRHLG